MRTKAVATAVIALIVLLSSITTPLVGASIGRVFYGIAFIGPDVIDDVTVYLEKRGKSEIYVKVVFEGLGESYESICIEIGSLKNLKVLSSLDDKLFVTLNNDGISGIVRDIASFIALKDRREAVRIHMEASKRLIDSGIIKRNGSLQISQQQTLQHRYLIDQELQLTQTAQDEQYGRFGYTQGMQGGQWCWEIYMDILGQRRPVEGYDHTKLKNLTSKYIRIDFLTTKQWPYLDEPMIYQGNAFKIYVRASSGLLDPYNPCPSGDGNAFSITIPLYLPGIGFKFITISWAHVRAGYFKSVSRLDWTNYGPRKSYPDYLAWNEILGSLNDNRPRDVGVRLNIADIGGVLTTYGLTVWGSVIVHQYVGEHLVSYLIDFPPKTFSITIIP